MANLIDDQTRDELKGIFARMRRNVTLTFFRREQCPGCEQQRELLETLASLSETISLNTYDIDTDKEEAARFGIDKVPATAVTADKDYGIRFYGITAGHEFGSFIQTLMLVEQGDAMLPPELEAFLSQIDTPVHLEVMTTLTCPYCARMVVTAHQLAMASTNIRSDMIDSAEFPQLVERYGVQGVPKTIINGESGFEGALPLPNVILELFKALKPELYAQIEKQLNEAMDTRAKAPAEPQTLYDIIIVGAGPAAMTAAIYAARKNLKTAVIGKHVGGQITDTSIIENWPGIESIGGMELARMMKNHARHYDIAETFDVKIERIAKEQGRFVLHASEGIAYRARSVIYCAGKEYRRLGSEGEARFIGKGIAFCATCDAPLYMDKNVAVVGGGNSALTAARDLLGFAKKIHLINRSDAFRADQPLIDEVLGSEIVTVHYGMQIEAFKGTNRLESVVLADRHGASGGELAVEGVFLEIGLSPNSAPLRDLAALNEKGEVIVDRQQATSVAGLFAAGDVTDEIDKQIIVAAGAGAKAALAAERYLNALTL
jgi:alkyl hydroperoxide reductase subunit F